MRTDSSDANFCTRSVCAAGKFSVPSPPPFLSLSLAGKDVLGGVNFASGGAGILNETGVYFVRHMLPLWL